MEGENIDKKYNITDAELEIMKEIWKKEGQTFKELFEKLEKEKPRNKNTVKTLLYRLVKKDAIWIAIFDEIDEKVRYWAGALIKEVYLKEENEKFLNKLYEGSAQKLILQLIEDKKIDKEEIKKLLNLD